MAKKNKKNRGSERHSRAPEVASQPAPAIETKPVARPEERREDKREEAASNVIQFPAQSKRQVTQIAVNDDVSRGDDAGDEAGDEDANEARREDTQPRRKTDDDRSSEAKKSEPPAKAESAAKTDSAAKAEDKGETDDDGPRREKRKRKSALTESAETRALGTGEHGVVTEEFFATKKKPAPAAEHDDFTDLQRSLEPMSASSRQAMWATVGILLVGLALIGSYYYYQNVHMPQPVELGRAGPVEMPQMASSGTTSPPAVRTPEVIEPTAVVEPTEAPEAVEPAVGIDVPAIAEGSTAELPEQVEAVEAPAEVVAVAPTAEAAVVTPAAEAAAPTETYESVLAQATAARGAARQTPLLERAIELNPSGAEALARLSYILVSRPGRANMERARDLAQRATAADPTNSQAWLVLGAARTELGDRAGAREAFQSCVDQGTGRYVNDCRSMR